MIVYKLWYGIIQDKRRGSILVQYDAWLLFGLIPLYLRIKDTSKVT